MTRAVKGYRKLKRLFKKHKFKEIFVIIAKSNKTPRQIAMGAAIGIFLSIIPTFGFGMLAALVIAWFWNFNIVATYLGSLIVNPLNASFVYYINYKIGSAIIGNGYGFTGIFTMDNLKFVAKQTYLGGFVLSAVMSFIGYLSIYHAVREYRKVSRKLETKIY